MPESLGSVGKSRDSTAKKDSSDASSGEVLRKLSSEGRSDNEIEKHRRKVTKDEGPSGSISDSKAGIDQSGASGINELSEDMEGLTIPKHEIIEGAAHGSETPQQARERNDGSKEKVIQKLDFDAAQSHNDGKRLEDHPRKSPKPRLKVPLPSRKFTLKNIKNKPRYKIRPYHNDGKWLEDHPWKSEKPSLKEPTKNEVCKSEVNTVSDKWLKSGKTKVHLKKIYLSLPTFIDEMRGPSIRKELEDILNSTLLKVIGSTNTKLSPHVLEIKQKYVPPNDEPSRPKPGENNKLKAFTVPPQQHPHQPSEDSYWFLDCEYMLKMYLPDYSLQWFNCGDEQGKRIREIKPEKNDERWIFIPSFRRAKIALLEWPGQDGIVTQESTIRILVVRPSEFEEYVKYCGHLFPVISLPQDEIGAGYPRYWIQKIAQRLELQFIWMIDDSVECFYEYHPSKNPPKHKDRDGELVCNYTDYRRRKFGLVFKRLEDLVKEADDNDKPIAAMSPRRWNPKYQPKEPFSCMPPQCAVYLNLRALSEKNVYYRPELKTFEDMMFGYESEQTGLKVYRDNRILLQDHKWKNTGASSPSVKSQ